MRYHLDVPLEQPPARVQPPAPVQVVVTVERPGNAEQRYRIDLEAGRKGELVLAVGDHRAVGSDEPVGPAERLVVAEEEVLAALSVEQWGRLIHQAGRCDHWETESIDALAWRDGPGADVEVLRPLLTVLATAAGDRSVMSRVVLGIPVDVAVTAH